MKIILLLFFISSCSNLFYQPTRYPYANPEQFVLKVEDIWFKSSDGTELNGWWMPSTIVKPLGSIVFFHGNAQNISSHFINLAWITHVGYNVFIFDYRGYGLSDGVPSQQGVYDDAIAGLDQGYELHQKNIPNGKFIVYGQSLGGVISLRAIPDFKFQDKIDLIVQDSTFMNYKMIAFDKLTDHWLSFIFSPLAFVLVSNEYASDDVVKKIHQPVLVIVGKKDRHVNPKFGKKIYKEVSSKKKWIWKINDGDHIDVFAKHDNKYRLKFIDLLSKL
jgi:fermentation-respiration switch protein FrsA (DUF1100 family)